ncbi:MAG: MBL fold metallo-hydrolase [Candidatus Bathyarchaeota archaeon]|nr:MBL fold metallo-hydrolase [Candidatus Bathyarchaeota archaeon]
MYTKRIGKKLYQVELNTGGIKQLICSYIIAGSKPLLVESGPTNSVPNLLLGIQELGIAPQAIEYVAITHVHLDHGGGAGTLLKHLPNAKVLVHPHGMPHLIDPRRLWSSSQEVLGFVSEIFGKPEPVQEERIIPLTEGTFDLGDGGKLCVLETLGHASHNLSFHESFNGGVFPGDAAGTYIPDCDVVVPTTPPPFYLDLALASLDKLIALKPSALYFSHFGKADDAVNRLRDYKVQIQLWADIAEEGVKHNRSLEQIRDNIIKQDPVMTIIADYVKAHRIYSKTVLENCVRGFMDYAKRKLEKQQS